MFVNLGFSSADNYMWSETFLILLAMGRNILISALRPESANFLGAAWNEVAAFWHRRAEK